MENSSVRMDRDGWKNAIAHEPDCPELPLAGDAGASLPEDTRVRMESSLQQDFSHIRVYQDSGLAETMGARAFAAGDNIHFAPGYYDVSSQNGLQLLGLSSLDDPWWLQALSWVPVAGDALDLARVPAQIKRAFERADKLEQRVERVLALQRQKAIELLPARLRRSPSYASELENLSYAEIVEMAKSNSKAAKMKKLIEQQHRLMDKL